MEFQKYNVKEKKEKEKKKVKKLLKKYIDMKFALKKIGSSFFFIFAKYSVIKVEIK